MLQVEDLCYSINGVPVLKGLNLTITKGHFYALAGENGAGKSTLIKIVLDLIRNIEKGKITLGGLDNKLLAARNFVSYLPEKFDIKKGVSGWQYLKFIAGVYKQPLDKLKIEDLCTRLSLDSSRLTHKTNNYSKGMKQKLGLISCFMLNNPLVILDEPLSGLDPKARFHFKQLLIKERESNRTIFYSTHLLADAEEICDQFGILHQGKIVFNGSPVECIDRFGVQSLEQAYMSCVTEYANTDS